MIGEVARPARTSLRSWDLCFSKHAMCLGHFVVLHVRVHIPCSGVNSPGCRYVRATELNKHAAVEAALLGHNLATRERKAASLVAVNA